jgi:hypothetical protein
MRSVMGYAAHLRVYEPLAAFDEDERARWRAYAESGDAPARPLLMEAERAAAVQALLRIPPGADVSAAGEHAYLRHADGLVYVCPWRLQLRAWEALDDFRSLLPEDLAEAFLPAASVEVADAAYDDWRAGHPDVQSGIRSSTWAVPLPWFTLFEPDERRLVLGSRRTAGAPPQTGLDRALLYLTAMSRARRRLARALRVVRQSFGEGAASAALAEIGRWLEDFHPHSLVELDYGGLVHLLDDDALSAEDSVGDIAKSLEHLAAADVGAAGERYEVVVDRWRGLAALEHAN